MTKRLLYLTILLSMIPMFTLASNYYVSPSGNNANDGSLANPWKSIQYAINTSVVLSGDTINAAAGVYDERLVINKAVTLLGATKGVSKKGYVVPANYAYDNDQESIISPTVDIATAIVKIMVDNVAIDGFIICNTITGTSAGDFRELVYLPNQSIDLINIHILNNVLGPNKNSFNTGKGRAAITTAGPTYRLRKFHIAGNKIFDNKEDGCGIMFLGTVGLKNINNSVLTSNTYAGTVIENNEITGNHRSGIELAGGVQGGTLPSEYMIIRNNIISNNGFGTISSVSITSDDTLLKYGNGISMQRVGSDRPFDDALGARYILIAGNEIKGNEKNGIYMGPVNKDIFIQGNQIENNGAGQVSSKWDGILIDMNEAYYLTGQNISFSANDSAAPGGPFAYATTIFMGNYTTYSVLSNIVIQENQVIGNYNKGINVTNQPTLGNVIATYNYWGANDGPLPTGSGNAVSSFADYIPFSLNTTITETATIDEGTTYVDVPSSDISFDFSDGSTGSGGSIMVSLAYSNPTGNTPGSLLNESNSLKKVWSIKTDITEFNVTLVFNYEDADIPAGVNEANLIPMRSTDGGLTWEAVSGTVTRDTVANWIKVSNVTGFSLWAFGDQSQGVPVELIEFKTE